MHPILFQFGSFTLHTYGVLVATGILLGLWLSRQRAARYGLDPDRVWNLGIYLVLAALLGAKVWYVFANWEYYSANPREIVSMATMQAAGVWYGGMLSALAVIVFYVRSTKLPLLPLTDAYFAPVSLGHAFGRLGCFTAGCCWGKPTAVAWGITFTKPYANMVVGVPLGVRLHPTQLYEATAEFAIFGILMWLTARQRFSGQIFAAYAMLYGAVRLTNEFFRGDPGRGDFFGTGLSHMQAVSIGLMILGAWLWFTGPSRPLKKK